MLTNTFCHKYLAKVKSFGLAKVQCMYENIKPLRHFGTKKLYCEKTCSPIERFCLYSKDWLKDRKLEIPLFYERKKAWTIKWTKMIIDLKGYGHVFLWLHEIWLLWSNDFIRFLCLFCIFKLRILVTRRKKKKEEVNNVCIYSDQETLIVVEIFKIILKIFEANSNFHVK